MENVVYKKWKFRTGLPYFLIMLLKFHMITRYFLFFVRGYRGSLKERYYKCVFPGLTWKYRIIYTYLWTKKLMKTFPLSVIFTFLKTYKFKTTVNKIINNIVRTAQKY
jgi:hypothetical protein